MRPTIIPKSNGLSSLKDLDVVILCGGQGTRLRSLVSDKPKVLANIAGKPFLEILIENLVSLGFSRIILSVGYLKEQIINHFRDYKLDNGDYVKIEFSEEEIPLGTGGAVKKAKPFIKSDNFLVINGDTFFPADFAELYDYHLENKALLSMVLANIEDARDCGSVKLDSAGRILSFNEKVSGKKSGLPRNVHRHALRGLVNAGIYLMKKEIFSHLPEEDCFSIEYDFFPKILGSQLCYGLISEGELIDIGTPERYGKAIKMFSK